jgi:hypothetical protein
MIKVKTLNALKGRAVFTNPTYEARKLAHSFPQQNSCDIAELHCIQTDKNNYSIKFSYEELIKQQKFQSQKS